MATFEIRKKNSSDIWEHIWNGANVDLILSDGWFRMVDDTFQLYGSSSGNIRYAKVTEIILYDETASGTPETFTDVLTFVTRLKALNYPYFYNRANNASGVDTVFGRSGNVVAELNDYSASLINNDSTVTGSTVKDALEHLESLIGPSAGDMLKSTYDPNLIEGDVFSMGNMVETASAKILTASERTQIADNALKVSFPGFTDLNTDYGVNLATVATSGDYDDLINQPTIPTSHTELTDIGTNTHAQIDSHISDSSIHFTQASISITESQISDFGSYLSSGDNVSELNNDAGYISSTSGDWTGTFDGEEGSYYLNYNNFVNTPTIPTATSDLSNDSGFITASSTDTFTNKSGNISQWTNDAGYISSVSGDWTGTFDGQEGTYYLDYNNFTNTPTIPTSHSELTDIGTNTHAQIDTHIADSTIHFTMASISIAASQVSDFDTEVSNNTDVVANTAKNSYPTADATKLGFISVTQAVDLDGIESDVSANNAKVSFPGFTSLSSDYGVTLATVATSGSYNDLSDQPTIPTATSDITNDSGFITNSSTDTLTNKSGSNSQWTNDEEYVKINFFQVQDSSGAGQTLTSTTYTDVNSSIWSTAFTGTGFSWDGSELTVDNDSDTIEFNVSIQGITTLNNRVELGVRLMEDTGSGYNTVTTVTQYALRNNAQNKGNVTLVTFYTFNVASGTKYKIQVNRTGVNCDIGTQGGTYFNAKRFSS